MKIFGILLTMTVGFIFNIVLYYASEDYRVFLKNLKSEKHVEQTNNEEYAVTDEYRVDLEEVKKENKSVSQTQEKELVDNSIADAQSENSPVETDSSFQKIEYTIEEEGKIEMSEYDTEFLEKFSSYNLTQLHSHGVLFDVNDEYPGDFFEYYSPDLTLYFFVGKTYDEVREIFELVSDGDIYTINEVDNFGEESFYINLGQLYDDGFIRIVFTKNGKTFGLKISKNEYNAVKEILNTL